MLMNGIEVRADRTYTPAETSEILGLKLGTLAAYRCGSNTGPAFVKVGRKILYRGSDLIAFVDASVRRSSVADNSEAA